ncbi:hypothetical protein [Streptomyces sp. NPDC006739]|uniref:hypothetical protein n=1 Tax=Streptomyces sp. NPDC006739 TaxID=3364763 RepID=UPI0036A1FEAA
MTYTEPYDDPEAADLAEVWADDQDDEEWQEGQCDMCFGSTPEDLQRAAESPGIVPVCACAIGQGAPADECRCGPEED